MENLLQDARYALRGMLKRPTFTFVVIVTLALGIGANATIFSVINSVVLQRLPYEDPEGIVFVWEQNYLRGVPTNVVSPANYLAWKDQNEVFSEIGAISQFSGTITGSEDPERVGVVQLSPEVFSILGVRSQLGRLLQPGDDAADAPTVVMLSHGFWQRRFGSDPETIGRTVTLNGAPFEVVGILPPGFDFELPVTFNSTGSQDVWFPMQLGEDARTARGRWLQVLARLQAGVSIERAHSQMTAIAQRLEHDHPEAQTGWTVNVVPLQSQVVGDVRTPLFILLGAVGFVLLIACANVANLLLSRATGRQQEIAVRTALGAGRSRVIRQLLTESIALALVGGLLGLLVAFGAVKALVALGPQHLPRLDELTVDGLAVAFTFTVSLATGVLFGALPAYRLSGPDISQSVTQGAVRGGTGRRHNRIRSGLVVAEFALSVVLLVGAGLLIRSFGKLLEVGVGFDTSNLITAQFSLPSRTYPEPSERARLFDDFVERVRTIPGVSDASAITFMPLTGTGSATSFWVNDRSVPPDGERPVADLRWVHQDYHSALGLPLLSGRYLGPEDDEEAPLSVIINEWGAQRFWPNEDPIGKTISMPWGDTLVARIVGVVGDVRHNGPTTEVRTQLYWDYRQFQPFNQITVFAQSAGDPGTLAVGMRRALAEVDPNLPLYNIRTVESYLGETLAQARFSMLALGLFAGIALILASIGIYGVMSYSVSERTREIGIRMALGASAEAVTGNVVRKGLVLIGIALLVGVGGSLALSRFMQGMVFEIGTNDPVTIAGVSALLAVVAITACWIPARRAAKIDPVAALRRE